MENYPDEFTMLYQRPQTDMAGKGRFRMVHTSPCIAFRICKPILSCTGVHLLGFRFCCFLCHLPAGEHCLPLAKGICQSCFVPNKTGSGKASVCVLLFNIPHAYFSPSSDCAEKLFDLVDSFAESAKRKAAVWPLQIILLILCPEITQNISRDVVEESTANKVRLPWVCFGLIPHLCPEYCWLYQERMTQRKSMGKIDV